MVMTPMAFEGRQHVPSVLNSKSTPDTTVVRSSTASLFPVSQRRERCWGTGWCGCTETAPTGLCQPQVGSPGDGETIHPGEHVRSDPFPAERTKKSSVAARTRISARTSPVLSFTGSPICFTMDFNQPRASHFVENLRKDGSHIITASATVSGRRTRTKAVAAAAWPAGTWGRTLRPAR